MESSRGVTTAASRVPRPPATGFRRVLAHAALVPALLGLPFLIMIVLGISGTSSALLYPEAHGPTAKDPGLIAGQPRVIRSDEWEVSTPLAISQYNTGLHSHSPSLAGSPDVTVVFDVPTDDWSMAFRPQNLGYAVLGNDQAQAFKWWSPAYLLLLATYWFVLELLPRRRSIGVFAGLVLLFSPAVQWWFGATTVLPMAGALASIALVLRLFAARTRWQTAGWALVLAYVVAVTGLTQYPPYQIPCALTAAAVCVGVLVRRARLDGRRLLMRALVTVGSVVVGGAVVGLFLLTRADVVSAIANTAYPGARVTATGGQAPWQLLSGVLDHTLLAANPDLGPTNQSEASAALLPGLFAAIAALWLLVRGRRRGFGVDPVLVALLLVLAVFLADLFIPDLGLLAKVTLLSVVPHARLSLGLGMLSIVLVVCVLAEARRQQLRALPLPLVGTVAAVAVVLQVWAAERTSVHLPGLAGSTVEWVGYSVLGGALAALLLRLPRAGMGALAALTVLVGAGVNPLQQGELNLATQPVGLAVRDIDAISPGGWISMGTEVASVTLLESGVRTYAGVFGYPVFPNWTDLDPTGVDRDLYNRYAHVIFVPGNRGRLINTLQQDVVMVRFDACDVFAQREIGHVLTDTPIADPCLHLLRVVRQGKVFYIYNVLRPTVAVTAVDGPTQQVRPQQVRPQPGASVAPRR